MKKHLPECEIVKREDYDMAGDPDVTLHSSNLSGPEREPGDS